METPAGRFARYIQYLPTMVEYSRNTVAPSPGGYSGAAMQVLTKGETRLEATKFRGYKCADSVVTVLCK